MPLRLLSILVSVPSVLFTLLSVLAMVLGSLQPPHPALAGFIVGCEDKPQPCWYGIVPQTTLTTNALHILSSYGFYPIEEPTNPSGAVTFHLQGPAFNFNLFGYGDSVVTAISLLPEINESSDVKFGNLMAILGMPDYLELDKYRAGELDRVFFNGVVADTDFYSFGFLAAFQPIEMLTIRLTPSRNCPRWCGFVREWRYHQLEIPCSQRNDEEFLLEHNVVNPDVEPTPLPP